MASSQGEPPQPQDDRPRDERPDNGGDGGGRRREGRGLVIGRPFGIPVHVSPYWFIIAGVFVVIYANDLGTYVSGTEKYVIAIAFVVLLYVSVLVHELSHSVVARGYGLPVRRILLYPLGGVSEIESEPQTPLREFCVSAAGPALSLVLAAAGWGLTHVVAYGWGGALVAQLMIANLIVGIFNLVPGLPLDGGRMLRAVIWQFTKKPSTATIAAAWAGRGIAVVILLGPIIVQYSFPGALTGLAGEVIGGGMISTAWTVVIAGFMWFGAGQSIRATKFRERIPALQARRLARKAVSVPAATPLAEAIRRADEVKARAVVVVDHDDKPIAIVNESAVMATPAQRRPWIDAGTLARAIEPSLVLPADISGMALLDAIKKTPASEYLLIEPSGEVYGVLATKDLDHVFAGV